MHLCSVSGTFLSVVQVPASALTAEASTAKTTLKEHSGSQAPPPPASRFRDLDFTGTDHLGSLSVFSPPL